MFSWVQKKLNGNKGSKRNLNPNTPSTNVLQERCWEEFIDWHHGLLTIGTFGNNNNNKGSEDNVDERSEGNPTLSQDNLSPEEVSQLHKELSLEDSNTLSKCIASLEADRFNGAECCEESESKGTRSLQRSNSAINQKSLSFLLKKMFVCRSGFAPAPCLNLKDPLPESRMEKILRAIIHKKIHPQSSSPKVSAKKYLKSRSQMSNSSKEDDETELDNGGKWDKTDSEYIVLKI